ncbi:MAG: hypothetical protein JSU90_03225 [Nitrospiraceae bacterium]|nr:MAG: hypothetical protein JSU90_03225 [Nitrospiraceae bacterium]
MKLGVFYIAAFLLLAAYPMMAGAWVKDRPVTPYGDYCPQCTKYGTCKTIMSHEDAKKAMLNYYDQKGLSVEMEKKEGRFIRAKVKEKNKVIDVIIFDRRTGRIRSIY